VADHALRAREHRVVVGEHRARPAVDAGGPGDQPVGRRARDQVLELPPPALRRERQPAVLHEAAGVDEVGDVLARRAPAGGVPAGDRLGPRGVLGGRAARAELLEVVVRHGRKPRTLDCPDGP
jgi:hypothetical protein